jgi:hypothetical protein
VTTLLDSWHQVFYRFGTFDSHNAHIDTGTHFEVHDTHFEALVYSLAREHTEWKRLRKLLVVCDRGGQYQ